MDSINGVNRIYIASSARTEVNAKLMSAMTELQRYDQIFGVLLDEILATSHGGNVRHAISRFSNYRQWLKTVIGDFEKIKVATEKYFTEKEIEDIESGKSLHSIIDFYYGHLRFR